MAMQPSTPQAPGAEPTAAHVPYLVQPLPDLDSWTRYFQSAEIPVLSSTSRRIEVLRSDEDSVDANMLSEVIDRDPLMTLKLLALVANKRRPDAATETESVTTSLVMMGISPFFANFGLQPTLQKWLADQPRALRGLANLMRRAERAAYFAHGFAVHRGDTDVLVIRLAAFLYDFAEMLMWCHAPTLQQRIVEMQRADSTLRTASVQRSVFNIELDDLRQNLMKLWHLPELLVRITDNRHAEQPIVRNVVLAVRLARHTADGWHNAALPDDIEDIAQLLNATPRVTMAFVRKIDPPI